MARNEIFGSIDDDLYKITQREENSKKRDFCEKFLKDGECEFYRCNFYCNFSHHPSVYIKSKWGRNVKQGLWRKLKDFQAWLLKYECPYREDIDSILDSIPWQGSLKYCVAAYRAGKIVSDSFDWKDEMKSGMFNIETFDSTQEQQLCRGFVNGGCTFGTNCFNSHSPALYFRDYCDDVTTEYWTWSSSFQVWLLKHSPSYVREYALTCREINWVESIKSIKIKYENSLLSMRERDESEARQKIQKTLLAKLEKNNVLTKLRSESSTMQSTFESLSQEDILNAKLPLPAESLKEVPNKLGNVLATSCRNIISEGLSKCKELEFAIVQTYELLKEGIEDNVILTESKFQSVCRNNFPNLLLKNEELKIYNTLREYINLLKLPPITSKDPTKRRRREELRASQRSGFEQVLLQESSLKLLETLTPVVVNELAVKALKDNDSQLTWSFPVAAISDSTTTSLISSMQLQNAGDFSNALTKSDSQFLLRADSTYSILDTTIGQTPPYESEGKTSEFDTVVDRFEEMCRHINISCECKQNGAAVMLCATCINTGKPFCKRCIRLHQNSANTCEHTLFTCCPLCGEFYNEIFLCKSCDNESNWYCSDCHKLKHNHITHEANLESFNLLTACCQRKYRTEFNSIPQPSSTTPQFPNEIIQKYEQFCEYRKINCACKSKGVAIAKCELCNDMNLFCQECFQLHNRQFATREHNILLFCHQCNNFKKDGEILSCDACEEADWICVDCHLDNHACEKKHFANLVSINLKAVLCSRNGIPNSSIPFRATSTTKSPAASSIKYSGRAVFSNAPVPVDNVPAPASFQNHISPFAPSSAKPIINDTSVVLNATSFATAGVCSTVEEEIVTQTRSCGGKVRMIRLRNILEELVLPILVESLRWHWSDPRLFLPHGQFGASIPASNRCIYHSNYHKFDFISNECLLKNVEIYETKCAAEMQGAIATAKKCLHQVKLGDHDDISSLLIAQVDIGVVCTLLRSMESSVGVGYPGDANILDELRNIRNLVCHRSELLEDDYNRSIHYIRNSLPTVQSRFSSCSKANFNIDAMIEKYSSTFLGKDLDEIYRQQILRDSRRDRELSVTKLLGYELGSNIADRSRMIVENMCSLSKVENHVKILIIPKSASCWSKDELSYMHFLRLIPWTVVYEVNTSVAGTTSPSTFEDFVEKNGGYMRNFIYDLLVYNRDQVLQELIQNSSVNTLVTSLINELQQVLTKCRYGGDSVRIFMAGISYFTTANANTDVQKFIRDLEDIHRTLFDTLSTKFPQTMMFPIVRHPQPLIDLKLAESEVDAIPWLCDEILIDSSVFSAMMPDEVIALPASTQRDGRIYFPTQTIAHLGDIIEVLHCECDAHPRYVNGEQLKALEERFGDDPQELESEILKEELKHFLTFGKNPVSWFLCKNDKLVTRTQLDEALKYFKEEQSKIETAYLIRKMIGSGGRTFARHLLYRLRERYLCVVVKNPPQSKSNDLKNLLQRLHDVTQLQVLTFLDVEDDRKEKLRETLSSRGVKFVFTSSRTDFSLIGAAKVLQLNPLYDDKELKKFNQLIPRKQIVLFDQRLGDDLISPMGFVDIEKFRKDEFWMALVNQAKYSDLLKAGFYPADIWLLRNQHEDEIAQQLSKTQQLSPLLCGLLFLDEDYRQQARNYVERVINELLQSTNDRQLLRLCVWFGLFAPSRGVKIAFANLIYCGQPLSTTDGWSPALNIFLATSKNAGGTHEVSIRLPSLSYMLASILFHVENSRNAQKRMEAARAFASFFHDTLFNITSQNASVAHDIVPDLIEMFCTYKGWNLPLEFLPMCNRVSKKLLFRGPSQNSSIIDMEIQPPQVSSSASSSSAAISASTKTSHAPLHIDLAEITASDSQREIQIITDSATNSFLIEFLHDCFDNRFDDRYQLVRDILQELVDVYSRLDECEAEKEIFITYLARYISNRARKIEDFVESWDLLNEAMKLCTGLLGHTAQDRRGKIGRDRLAVIHKYLTSNTDAAEILRTEGRITIKGVELNIRDIWAIATEANDSFTKSQAGSLCLWPNPLIGSVQLWRELLDLLKIHILCKPSEVEFIQYLRNVQTKKTGLDIKSNSKKKAPAFPCDEILREIKIDEIFDSCYESLDFARKAVFSRYIRAKTQDASLSEMVNTKRSNELIKKNRALLDKYWNASLLDRNNNTLNSNNPNSSEFWLISNDAQHCLDITTARHFLLRIDFTKKVGKNNEIAMVSYALLTFAVEFVRRLSPPSLKANEATSDALNVVHFVTDSLENSWSIFEYFLVLSTVLTPKNNHALQNYTKILNRCESNQQRIIESYLNPENIRLFLSTAAEPNIKLPPEGPLRLWTACVLFYLWSILFQKDDKERNMQALSHAVTKLRAEADPGKYRHINKSRLYLADHAALAGNPFTAFYRTEDLPFNTHSLPTQIELEITYAEEGPNYFYQLTGQVVFRQRKRDDNGNTYNRSNSKSSNNLFYRNRNCNSNWKKQDSEIDVFVTCDQFPNLNPNAPFYIECSRCYRPSGDFGNQQFELEEGDRVSYFIAIRENKGLFAVGLTVLSE